MCDLHIEVSIYLIYLNTRVASQAREPEVSLIEDIPMTMEAHKLE